MPPPDRDHLSQPRALHEPHDPEVRLVNAQQHRRLEADRPLVVRGPRRVRRPDLDEPRSRLRQHLGNRNPSPISISSPRETTTSRPSAKAASASRTAAALLFTTGRPPRRSAAAAACDVILPRPATADREVVLEVRVPAPDLPDALQSRFAQQRPAEIRVHEDAGRVQHRPKLQARAEPTTPARATRSPGSNPARISSRASSSTVRAASKPRADRTRARQLVHGRQVAQPHRPTVRPLA